MAVPCYKLVIVGDASVGKTQIMGRYAKDEFVEESMTTIGVEYENKIIEIKNDDGSTKKSKLQIWDTAGQERFRAISRSIYHGARGVMVVYDITRQPTFDHVPSWLEEIRAILAADTPIFLLGNKSDLEDDREVKTEAADVFAKEHGLIFFETSAKNNTNVAKAFEWLAKRISDSEKLLISNHDDASGQQQEQQQSSSNKRVSASSGRVNLMKTKAGEDATASSDGKSSSSGGKCGKC